MKSCLYVTAFVKSTFFSLFPCADKFGVLRYLFQGQCRDACPEGFYHSKRKQCEPCSAHCAVCLAEDHCLRCSPGHQLRKGQCVPLECSIGGWRSSHSYFSCLSKSSSICHGWVSLNMKKVPLTQEMLKDLSKASNFTQPLSGAGRLNLAEVNSKKAFH